MNPIEMKCWQCIYSTKGPSERTTFVIGNFSPCRIEIGLFSLSIEMMRGHERQTNVTAMKVISLFSRSIVQRLLVSSGQSNFLMQDATRPSYSKTAL